MGPSSSMMEDADFAEQALKMMLHGIMESMEHACVLLKKEDRAGAVAMLAVVTGSAQLVEKMLHDAFMHHEESWYMEARSGANEVRSAIENIHDIIRGH